MMRKSKIATKFLLNLVAVLVYKIEFLAAELVVDKILKECEDTGLDAEDCEALIAL